MDGRDDRTKQCSDQSLWTRPPVPALVWTKLARFHPTQSKRNNIKATVGRDNSMKDEKAEEADPDLHQGPGPSL